MTVTSALAFNPRAIARLGWSTGTEVVIGDNGALWYRRYPTSFGWEWKPSAADLVAEDYIAFDEFSR